MDLTYLNRHKKVALCFSGGKDSLAVLWLLRDHLDRMTVYHMDTGDLLPEIVDTVAKVEPLCPNFVRVKTDARAWMNEFGLPTDLLPYSTHGIGVAAGQDGLRLVTRYHCCFHNLMYPLDARIRADGNTLSIRGTKLIDQRRIPAPSGTVANGLEIWNPIETWTNDDVFAYLKQEGAPLASVYEHMTNAPECARCPAWWSEGRAKYLREYHPVLFDDYRHDLRRVAKELTSPIRHLLREMEAADVRFS